MFATSSTPGSVVINCAGVSINVNTNIDTISCPSNSECYGLTGTFKKSIFQYPLGGDSRSPGVNIVVYKNTDTNETTVFSRGYNINDPSNPRQLERAVQLTYLPKNNGLFCGINGNIMILLDMSGSMYPSGYVDCTQSTNSDFPSCIVKTAVAQLVNGIFTNSPNAKVGIIQFGSGAQYLYHLTNNSTTIRANDIPLGEGVYFSSYFTDYGQATDLQGGIRLARYEFDNLSYPASSTYPDVSLTIPTTVAYNNSGKPNYILVITDGAPHGYHDDTEGGLFDHYQDASGTEEGKVPVLTATALEAQAARQEGTTIYSILINSGDSNNCQYSSVNHAIDSSVSNGSCVDYITDKVAGAGVNSNSPSPYSYNSTDYGGLSTITNTLTNCSSAPSNCLSLGESWNPVSQTCVKISN